MTHLFISGRAWKPTVKLFPASVDTNAPVAAIAAGQPIPVIALVERSPKTHGLLVLLNSPIKKVTDLKGKKIGNPSGKSYFFAVQVLERAGLKDTDVQRVQIENDAGTA
ncbi:ABC transporter substrate-binding protein [Nostoc sp. C052]|uniref:ABC transporter substrate-binding protein n=1 Tax=Nostoc sp. C052 TaxID=2576902 RepID=UPI00277B5798|nr:ABC transporter substrate-binding protein [Nostoc sp. C052]